MQQPMPPITSTTGPEWNALHTLSVFLKVIAWITGAVGIIGFFQVFSQAQSLSSSSFFGADTSGPLFISAFTILFGAIIGFITLYAIGEVILLLIAIEKNTRKP